MPKAPADYQLRYPIDFGDIDPSFRQRPVQLYAADFGKSRGILYLPATGKPRTVVIMAHPRADFSTHYSIPYWVAAGFAAFGLNTRYLNNDSMMLHENLLLDLAAGIRFLREEEGFEKIVMLGNSGGGSSVRVLRFASAHARGNRVAAPPAGGPPDLNKFDLPAADGYIVLAAHPGQGMVLMSCLDAAVVDESDPLASDAALDMYDERNGFETPPAESRYSKDFIERYRSGTARAMRANRRDRAAPCRGRRTWPRCDACARLRGVERGQSQLLARRAMAPHYMVVYRTQANPELSRSVDRSVGTRRGIDHLAATRPGELLAVRPWPNRNARRVAIDLVRLVVVREDGANLPKVTVPTLVVGANGDQDIFISDVRGEFEASGASDKTLAFIEGADHFMRAGGAKAHLGDPRPRLMKVLTDWTRERFAS